MTRKTKSVTTNKLINMSEDLMRLACIGCDLYDRGVDCDRCGCTRDECDEHQRYYAAAIRRKLEARDDATS